MATAGSPSGGNGPNTLKHVVCFSVLCRRRWRPLDPDLLPIFCPSCRKQLNILVGRAPNSMYLARWTPREWKALVMTWHAIQTEMYQILNVANDCALVTEPGKIPLFNDDDYDHETFDEFETREEAVAEEHCRRKELFHRIFGTQPAVDSVQSWNSVLPRRKHHLGTVTTNTRYVKEVLLTSNYNHSGWKRHYSGPYFVTDFMNELQPGLEFLLFVFSNPSKSESSGLPKLLKRLSHFQPKAAPTTVGAKEDGWISFPKSSGDAMRELQSVVEVAPRHSHLGSKAAKAHAAHILPEKPVAHAFPIYRQPILPKRSVKEHPAAYTPPEKYDTEEGSDHEAEGKDNGMLHRPPLLAPAIRPPILSVPTSAMELLRQYGLPVSNGRMSKLMNWSDADEY